MKDGLKQPKAATCYLYSDSLNLLVIVLWFANFT